MIVPMMTLVLLEMNMVLITLMMTMMTGIKLNEKDEGYDNDILYSEA